MTVRGTKGAAGFVSRASLDDTAGREVTDAASLVEPLPGVHVRRLGADDSFATLSIRGSTSSQVAVQLAGVPLTGGADPSLDLGSLPLWPGARVRVYRSFTPATMGAGSLGGTLAIDPPSPLAARETELWVAAGSYGSVRARAADVRALGDDGRTRLVTGLSASRADDDFGYFDPTASTAGRDVYASRGNAGHTALNGLVAYAMPVRIGTGPEGTFAVTALAQARSQGVPGTVFAPTPFQTLDSNRELASISLTLPAAHGAWSARAWGRRDGVVVTDKPASALLGPSHARDAIVATGGALGWEGALGERASLEARVDASGEKYAPGAWVGATQPAGASRVSAGAGLDATLRATDAWTWSASGRADAWNDASDDPSAPGRGEARPTGHVGTEVRVGPLSLLAHGGAVARPPSFVERYGDHGLFLGNPALGPESAWTVDAGARVETKGAASASSKFGARAELAGFATWATDLITFVSEGAYGRARASNIGRARVLGLEADASAHAAGVELRASYTALATSNESECAAASGAIGATLACDRPSLPGRPASDLVADLAYTLGPLRARYGVDAVSGIQADRVGVVVVPPRVLQSAGLRLDVPGVRGLRLAVDARNLFDVRTATYTGVLGPVHEAIGDLYEYPLPGRTVLVSLRWLDRE